MRKQAIVAAQLAALGLVFGVGCDKSAAPSTEATSTEKDDKAKDHDKAAEAPSKKGSGSEDGLEVVKGEAKAVLKEKGAAATIEATAGTTSATVNTKNGDTTKVVGGGGNSTVDLNGDGTKDVNVKSKGAPGVQVSGDGKKVTVGGITIDN